jgi:hypothetical protein
VVFLAWIAFISKQSFQTKRPMSPFGRFEISVDVRSAVGIGDKRTWRTKNSTPPARSRGPLYKMFNSPSIRTSPLWATILTLVIFARSLAVPCARVFLMGAERYWQNHQRLFGPCQPHARFDSLCGKGFRRISRSGIFHKNNVATAQRGPVVPSNLAGVSPKSSD